MNVREATTPKELGVAIGEIVNILRDRFPMTDKEMDTLIEVFTSVSERAYRIGYRDALNDFREGYRINEHLL